MDDYTRIVCERCGGECSCFGNFYARVPLAFEDSSQLDGSRLLSLDSFQGRQRGGSSQNSSAYRGGPFYHRRRSGSSRDHEEVSSRASLPDEHRQPGQNDIASSGIQTVAPTGDNDGPNDADSHQQQDPNRPGNVTALSASDKASRIPWLRKSIRRRISRLFVKVRQTTKRVAHRVHVFHRPGPPKDVKAMGKSPAPEPTTETGETPDVASGVIYRRSKEDIINLCPVCKRPFKEIRTEASDSQEPERIVYCRHGSDTSSVGLMASPTRSYSQSPDQSSGSGSLRGRPNTPVIFRFALGGQPQSLDDICPGGSEFSFTDHDSQAPTEVEGAEPRHNASGDGYTRYDDSTQRRDFAASNT